MTNEKMILKAKEAKSAEEILAFAKENGFEMTAEQAKEYFEKYHNADELSDDTLDGVTGGTLCSSYDYLLVKERKEFNV